MLSLCVHDVLRFLRKVGPSIVLLVVIEISF